MPSILEKLKSEYKNKREKIVNRLTEFKKGNISDELFFCLLTPQSKAKICWDALLKIKEKNLLFKGTKKQLQNCLQGIRFNKNKSEYIVEARKKLKMIEDMVKKNFKNPEKIRVWLVKNIKGFGYKEASHFLRNIGLGENIAILDRHILKNLKRFKVIKEVPTSISPRKYLEIENKMKLFSKKIKIPVSHLDLLFWSKETGQIFK